MVAIKALWDSYWLSQTDKTAFIAFGFIFPIIILINTVIISMTNATLSTFSLLAWVDKENVRINKKIFSIFSLCAIATGLVISAVIYLLVPLMIDLLSANAYQQQINQFCRLLILWLPVQFLLTVWQCVARGLGKFKSSSNIATVCYLIGMLLSYWLLVGQSGLAPMAAIVYSSAMTTLLTLIWFGLTLFRHTTFYTQTATMTLVSKAAKPFLVVFFSSFITNAFALIFIFGLMRLMAQQGEDVIAAMVYLTRLEQLLLIFYSAFISVMLPETAHLIRKRQLDDALSYIHQAGRFLFVIGVLSTAILYSVLLLLNPAIFGSTSANDILLLLSGYWFIGLLLQGPGIFYLQLINILIAPKLAPRINFIRFIVFALPLIYLAEIFYGLEAILLCLPVIHATSLAGLLVLFASRWQTYRIEKQQTAAS
jgi:Na+-driven multidrug efflux pump